MLQQQTKKQQDDINSAIGQQRYNDQLKYIQKKAALKAERQLQLQPGSMRLHCQLHTDVQGKRELQRYGTHT